METVPQVKNYADPETYANDISEETAKRAYQNTSWTPEERGARDRVNYKKAMAAQYAELKPIADAHGAAEAFNEAWARYAGGMAHNNNAWMHSSSRCLSSAVVGPSNFPVAMAQKRNNIAHKRLNEMLDYEREGLARLRRICRPDLAPIRCEDANASQRIESKLERLEKNQAMMKAANEAIRASKKGGHTAQLAAAVAVGFSEEQATDILKPDFAGRVGFPPYALQNNNANIRRLKGRAVEVETKQAKEAKITQGPAARVEEVPAENRVRLFFPGKPERETIQRLKSAGFRWTPSLMCWQAYYGARYVREALQFAGLQLIAA